MGAALADALEARRLLGLGVQLRVLTGETYVVENKPGASTAIGMREFGMAKPDGRMRRLRWGLAVTVVTLPGLAASGFLAMSREVATSRAPGAPDARTTSADADALRRWREGLVATYVAMLVAAFSAGRLREWRFPHDDGDRQ